MKKVVLGLWLASSSMFALGAENAEQSTWVGALSYANMSEDADGVDISLGAIVGSVGYKQRAAEGLYVVPELRVGFGLSDDRLIIYGVSVDAKLDRFIALSLKTQYEFNNGLYVFAVPSYANAKFSAKASYLNQSVSDDSWELGLGVGAGYKLGSTTFAEVGYEQFDGTDVLSIGVRFNF